MSEKTMSTTKSVEGDAAANSTTPPMNHTASSATRTLSDPQLRIFFERNRNLDMTAVWESKFGAIAALAGLRADLTALHQLLIAKEDEQKARDDDSSKENAATPASRADILALQEQIEQLYNGAKQDATPSAHTEDDLRAKVASLKKAIAELSTEVKEDKEAQSVALERGKLWSKLFREGFPAFLDELWDATKEPAAHQAASLKDVQTALDNRARFYAREAGRSLDKSPPATIRAEMSATRARRAATKEPRTQRAISPQAGDSSSSDDGKERLRFELRATIRELRNVRAKMSRMRASRAVVDDESDSEPDGMHPFRGNVRINPVPADDWFEKLVHG